MEDTITVALTCEYAQHYSYSRALHTHPSVVKTLIHSKLFILVELFFSLDNKGAKVVRDSGNTLHGEK